MFDVVRAATFAILDSGGLPVGCGVFVSACGLALTSAHEAKKWQRKRGNKLMARAATRDDTEFDVEVVERTVGDVDVAVLRLPAPAASQAWLPIPETTFTEKDLSGAPMNVVYGSIAWSSGASASNFAQAAGSIVASSSKAILYSVSPRERHSGAAIILRDKQVIGLHADADLEESSTHATAVRLDVPAVRAAVERLVKRTST
jgi:hypothetical protein